MDSLQLTASEPLLLPRATLFEGDVDGVARPSLVVMNAAISALALKRDSLISSVLQWGRSFGLQPDRLSEFCQVPFAKLLTPLERHLDTLLSSVELY